VKKVKKIALALLFSVGIFTSSSPAESRLNQYTTNNQTDPAIAADANGNSMVVWSSYFQDGNSGGIIGRRFDANLTALGDEFQINTTTTGNQSNPASAMNKTGDFIVVWQGPGPSEEDIFARRFEPNGQPAGNEFRINDITAGRQLYPKAAVSNSGAFVCVWEDNEFWPQFDYLQILYKLYDSNGTAIKADSASLVSQCRYPDVAIDGSGNFTIVWMQDDDWHSCNVVMMRQFDANGTAASEPCEVSTIPFNTITRPAIAMEPTGHFVVSWYGHPDGAAFNNIYARRYKFDGTAMTEQFIVNTTTEGPQQSPAVAMNNQRDFIIVWNSDTGPGGNERDIFGQRFDSSSNPVGGEFQINTYVFGDQKYPDIALRGNGKFAVVWQSDTQDGSGFGIFGEGGPKAGCGDFTGDGFVNFNDYCILAGQWQKQQSTTEADLIDDNEINGLDLAAFCMQWLSPRYLCAQADIHSDGFINLEDYRLLAEQWLRNGPSNEDISGDGLVDMIDLKALLFHWLKSCE